jgi:predicted transglutaminase-like cysteine proteinase
MLQETDSMIRFELLVNGHKIPVFRSAVIIGRANVFGRHPDSELFSNEQFKLSPNCGGWTVTHMSGAKHPTIVNNSILIGTRKVSNGMTVTVRGASGIPLVLRIIKPHCQAVASTTISPTSQNQSVCDNLPNLPFGINQKYRCGQCDGHFNSFPKVRGGFFCFCQQCKSLLFYIVEGVSGQQCYPWQYLRGSRWPRSNGCKAVSYSIERVEEIWMDVARTLKYVADEDQFNGRQEVWQTASECIKNGAGDCEDHCITLADWLITEGYEIRVVLGQTKYGAIDWYTHAWVVLRLNGEEYLIESTQKTSKDASAPSRTDRGFVRWREYYRLKLIKTFFDSYRPFFAFDSSQIWVRKGVNLSAPEKIVSPSTTDSYFNDTAWVKGSWLRQV